MQLYAQALRTPYTQWNYTYKAKFKQKKPKQTTLRTIKVEERENDEYYDHEVPERQLVAAIISRALVDYSGNTVLGGHLDSNAKRNAKAWFKSKSSRPFGFIWCCEVLDIEPIKIIKFIDNLREPLKADLAE